MDTEESSQEGKTGNSGKVGMSFTCTFMLSCTFKISHIVCATLRCAQAWILNMNHPETHLEKWTCTKLSRGVTTPPNSQEV